MQRITGISVSAFNEHLLPAANDFQPDLVLISAGFDARQSDPLGDFNVSDEGFAALTRLVMSIAEAHAGNRIVSTLEGGYNTEGLAMAVEAHLNTLRVDWWIQFAHRCDRGVAEN